MCGCNKSTPRRTPSRPPRSLQSTNPTRTVTRTTAFQNPVSSQTRSQRTRIEKLRADAIKRTFGR